MESSRQSVSAIEYAFAFAGLLLMTGALAPIYKSYEHLYSGLSQRFDLTSANLEFQLLSGGTYLISLALLLRHSAAVMDVLSKNKALLLFVGFVLLSSIWAQEPSVSLRRSMALAGTTIFAIYVSVRFPPDIFIALLTAVLVVVIVQTFFVSTMFPVIGIHSDIHNGAWRGVLGHKNEAGRLMVFAAIILWVYSGFNTPYKMFVRIALVFCLALIILTQSKTSLVVILTLILSVAMVRVLRRSSINLGLRLTLISLVVILPAALLGLNFYEQGLELLGRDGTLSGRTDIWETAIEAGLTRPLLGFGYRSFWIDSGAIAFLPISDGLGHGHNSFLDIWLEVGFVGFGIFAVVYFSAVRRAFWRLTHSQDSLGTWYILFLFALTLFALTTQALPRQGSIEWVLFVAILIHLTPTTQPVRTPQVAERSLAT